MASELDSDCRLQVRECRELARESARETSPLKDDPAATGFPAPCPQIGEYASVVWEREEDRTVLSHYDWLGLFDDNWGQTQAYSLRDIQLWAKDAHLDVMVWWGCFSRYVDIVRTRGEPVAPAIAAANAVGQYASQLARLDRLVGRLRAAIRRGELSHP